MFGASSIRVIVAALRDIPTDTAQFDRSGPALLTLEVGGFLEPFAPELSKELWEPTEPSERSSQLFEKD